MGAKQSTESAVNGRSTSRHTAAVANGVGEHSRVVSLDSRIRTRSLNSVDHSFPIPSHQNGFQDSGLTSNDDNSTQLRGLYTIQGAHSLPAQLFATSFITGKLYGNYSFFLLFAAIVYVMEYVILCILLWC